MESDYFDLQYDDTRGLRVCQSIIYMLQDGSRFYESEKKKKKKKNQNIILKIF